MLLGVGLWVGFSMHFKAEDKLDYEPNLGCIKGSPYGKVLALAMQGPIDFYWHEGQTHEHAETLNAAHSHADGTSHSHDDHDHSHGHDHAHDHGDGHSEESREQPVVKKTEQAVAQKTKEEPLHTLAKAQIKKMSATAHRKTDGKPLSKAHRKYLQSVTEDKLRLAYELDPTNYTNYGNLHLFLATTTFGKSDANDDTATELAKRTLEICKQEKIDPASWVTAISAAYNIIFHIGRYHEQFTVAEAKASLAEFDACMATYRRLLDDAVANGRIPSAARLEELNERTKYLSKLRYAQGVYMKRMMSTRMAGGPDTQTTH